MNDPKNKVEKQPKKNKKQIGNALHSIIGVLLALSVISIGYSTTVILMGTEGIAPIVMVIPQVGLALAIVIWKFCK